MLYACNDENKYEYLLEQDEKVYLGRPDTVKIFSGLGKMKLSWYMSPDPRVQETRIYWNQGADSAVTPFIRTVDGIQKDSTLISSLSEGRYDFQLVTTNDAGQRSLPVSVSGTVWGNVFISTLPDRKLDGGFTYQAGTLSLNLTAVNEAEVCYTRLKYTHAGAEVVKKIDNATTAVTIPNFPDGADFRLETVFFYPEGMDTLVSEYKTYKTRVAAVGRKVFSLADLKAGSTANDLMFSWGSSLVHRTSTGELEVFDMTGAKTGPLLGDASAPWSGMREIMYCQDNILLTISTAASTVGFFTLSGNQATLVNAAFGNGFNFKHFLPFTNLFYSISAEGQTKRWNFYPDATWNWGATDVVISTGDQIYGPVCSWNNCAVIGVTADGKLWYRTVTTADNGTITGWFELGSGGWNRYVRIFGIGTSLLCLDAAGEFWLYEDINTTGTSWVIE
jgi:hypothetical protein